MSYPITLQSMIGGTRITVDPHVSDTEQGSGAARHCAAMARRRRASPAVTSTRHDPHDLLDLLTYLVEPLVGATHAGGTHGGTAEPDNGATPAVATAT